MKIQRRVKVNNKWQRWTTEASYKHDNFDLKIHMPAADKILESDPAHDVQVRVIDKDKHTLWSGFNPNAKQREINLRNYKPIYDPTVYWNEMTKPKVRKTRSDKGKKRVPRKAKNQ